MASAYSLLARYNDYIAPVDLGLLGQGLAMKQQQYDTNYAMLQQSIQEVANLDLVKPEDINYLKNRLDTVINTVNEAGGLDLSKNSVTQVLNANIRGAIDKNVMNGFLSTQQYRKEQRENEELFKKNPKAYDVRNYADYMEKFDAWYNDGQTGSVYSGNKYTPYVDIDAEVRKVLAQAKDSLKYKVAGSTTHPDNPYYMVDNEEIGYSPTKVSEAISSVLANNAPQVAINAKYAMAGNTAEGLVSTLRERISMTDDTISKYDANIKAAGNNTQEVTKLTQEKESLLARRLRDESMIDRLAEGEVENVSKELYTNMLHDTYMNQYSGVISRTSKVKANTVALQLAKLDFDRAKWAEEKDLRVRKMQQDWEVAKLKNAGTGTNVPIAPSTEGDPTTKTSNIEKSINEEINTARADATSSAKTLLDSILDRAETPEEGQAKLAEYGITGYDGTITDDILSQISKLYETDAVGFESSPETTALTTSINRLQRATADSNKLNKAVYDERDNRYNSFIDTTINEGSISELGILVRGQPMTNINVDGTGDIFEGISNRAAMQVVMAQQELDGLRAKGWGYEDEALQLVKYISTKLGVADEITFERTKTTALGRQLRNAGAHIYNGWQDFWFKDPRRKEPQELWRDDIEPIATAVEEALSRKGITYIMNRKFGGAKASSAEARERESQRYGIQGQDILDMRNKFGYEAKDAFKQTRRPNVDEAKRNVENSELGTVYSPLRKINTIKPNTGSKTSAMYGKASALIKRGHELRPNSTLEIAQVPGDETGTQFTMTYTIHAKQGKTVEDKVNLNIDQVVDLLGEKEGQELLDMVQDVPSWLMARGVDQELKSTYYALKDTDSKTLLDNAKVLYGEEWYNANKALLEEVLGENSTFRISAAETNGTWGFNYYINKQLVYNHTVRDSKGNPATYLTTKTYNLFTDVGNNLGYSLTEIMQAGLLPDILGAYLKKTQGRDTSVKPEDVVKETEQPTE